MKYFNFAHILIAIIYISASNLSWATDIKYEHASEEHSEIIKLLDNESSFSQKHSEIILAAESDRGCCVWKTEKTKCSYTNEGYCRHKAKGAKIKFEFYKNKPCKELPVCK